MSSSKFPQNSLFTFIGVLANPDHFIFSNSQFYLYCFLRRLNCQLLQAQSLLFTFHNFPRCCVSSWYFVLRLRLYHLIIKYSHNNRSSFPSCLQVLFLSPESGGWFGSQKTSHHTLSLFNDNFWFSFVFFVDAIYLTRPFSQFHSPFLIMYCFIFFFTNSLLH